MTLMTWMRILSLTDVAASRIPVDLEHFDKIIFNMKLYILISVMKDLQNLINFQ